jgi:iron complex transport system substrate-binding protein
MFALALLLGASAVHAAGPRVVSMNLCTDQLVMMLADPDQIVSLSPMATDAHSSALRDTAGQFTQNSGSAEEIYLSKPDLIVAGLYTEKASVHMLQSLDLRVEIFEPADSFDAVRANIVRLAKVIGHPDRGHAMVADFDARLAALQSGIAQRPRAILYHANGYTSGAQSLSNDILTAAGFENLAVELGLTWGGTVPLERLIMIDPDVVITGRPFPGHSRGEEILRHPALTPLKMSAHTDARWVCGTPMVLDAIQDLQREHPDKRSQ